MKLKRGDKVIVITGRDKGKTGAILAVMPATSQVLVENLNIVKRHTKPSKKQPRGGILEIAKPLAASKVMAIDPASGKPARIGYAIKADGSKERVFKVSPNHDSKSTKATKADQAVPSKAKTTPKAGKKT